MLRHRQRFAGESWNDFSALEQALSICRARPDQIDHDRVRGWCARERQAAKYQLFHARLERLGLVPGAPIP